MAKLLHSFSTTAGIPLLLKELGGHCAGHAVRSDCVGVTDAPAGRVAIPEFPKGYRAGKLWIDYTF